jgi:putative ABC transport system substrate-binding protein
MRRREFITLLGGATTLALPRASAAQQKPRRIGVLLLYADSDPIAQGWVAALREGLHAAGWKDGSNIQMELRWVAPEAAALQKSAKELVALQPDVLVSSNTPTTRALIQETKTIPIVFANLVDPVGSGFVASESKPGGNVTGFVNLQPSVSGKYLELLKEIAPNVKRVALFYNPTTATYADIYVKPFRTAASVLGVEPMVAPVQSMTELETVMAAVAKDSNGGLISMPDGFNSRHRSEITAMAARHKLPAIYSQSTFVRTGGLISYGNDQTDNYRRTGGYVDRILKGEKPSDLPVQLPVKFELAINLKVARALGLDVPPFLQQRADEVIE